MTNRRIFIKTAAVLSSGLLLDQNVFAADKKQAVGLQLYTLRKLISNKNVAEVLAKVAAIGYKELEMFGYSGRDKFWGMEPKAFRSLLKSTGLSAPSTHVSFENFLTGKDENELRLICDAASIAGNKYIVVAWLEEKYRKTADDYKRIAAKLNKAAIITGQYGMQLAYHNHDFEFKTLENEMTGFDIILKDTDPTLLQLELDLYWAVKAGADPVELFNAHPGRFALWHVKDMDKVSGSFTEVGAGSIDFKRIFEHKKTAGLKHFFIEQDEVQKDVFESIKESYGHVYRNIIAR